MPAIRSLEMSEAYVRLIMTQGRWDWFVTLTTREHLGRESLEKKFRTLVRRIETDKRGLGLVIPGAVKDMRLRWVCAWERQERGAWHLHVLMAAPNLPSARRVAVARWWEDLCWKRGELLIERSGETSLGQPIDWLVTQDSPSRGKRGWKATGEIPPGFADVQLVKGQEAVAKYCAKYVVKGGDVVLSAA